MPDALPGSLQSERLQLVLDLHGGFCAVSVVVGDIEVGSVLRRRIPSVVAVMASIAVISKDVAGWRVLQAASGVAASYFTSNKQI